MTERRYNKDDVIDIDYVDRSARRQSLLDKLSSIFFTKTNVILGTSLLVAGIHVNQHPQGPKEGVRKLAQDTGVMVGDAVHGFQEGMSGLSSCQEAFMAETREKFECDESKVRQVAKDAGYATEIVTSGFMSGYNRTRSKDM